MNGKKYVKVCICGYHINEKYMYIQKYTDAIDILLPPNDRRISRKDRHYMIFPELDPEVPQEYAYMMNHYNAFCVHRHSGLQMSTQKGAIMIYRHLVRLLSKHMDKKSKQIKISNDYFMLKLDKPAMDASIDVFTFFWERLVLGMRLHVMTNVTERPEIDINIFIPQEKCLIAAQYHDLGKNNPELQKIIDDALAAKGKTAQRKQTNNQGDKGGADKEENDDDDNDDDDDDDKEEEKHQQDPDKTKRRESDISSPSSSRRKSSGVSSTSSYGPMKTLGIEGGTSVQIHQSEKVRKLVVDKKTATSKEFGKLSKRVERVKKNWDKKPRKNRKTEVC